MSSNQTKKFSTLLRRSVAAIALLASGWAAVQKTHFADGGVYDQIVARK